MITFPLLGQTGRLGNQLWQIASTIGIAATLGETVSFPHWAYQPYFCVPHIYFDGKTGMDATESILAQHIDNQARIYLQDYSLWENSSTTIKKWLQPSIEAFQILTGPEYDQFWDLEPPVLGLHVRRGDNAYDPGTPDKHNYHPLRPMSYYRDAMELLDGEYQSVACFSDDPTWCEANFTDVDYFHHGTPRPKEHEPEYATAPVLDWIDLQLLSMCDRHIISNSTYSWWGAYLSDDPSPVYPDPWFGPKLNFIDSDLMFPSHWRKLTHVHSS